MRTLAQLVVCCFVAFSGCGGGTSVDPSPRSVRLLPEDLRTGLATAGIADEVRVTVRHGSEPAFLDRELPTWEGSIRVVRWPGHETVAGIFRGESVDFGTYAFAFVPDSDLQEGWYAIQVNLGRIATSRTPERPELTDDGGWTTSRFHVGSFPIVRVYGTLADPHEDIAPVDGSSLTVTVSEPVVLDGEIVLADYLLLDVNGERVACGDRRYDSPPSGILGYTTVTCPRVPDGARIELALREDLLPPGVRLHDIRGLSPPRWEFEEGLAPDGDGRASEALFGAPSQREAP